LPTHSQLIEEEQAKDDLPCFGNKNIDDNKFNDPLAEEHQEIANLLEKMVDTNKDDDSKAQPPLMLTNDDSFSNIAPAVDGEQN
jgi:hypothetical protein